MAAYSAAAAPLYWPYDPYYAGYGPGPGAPSGMREPEPSVGDIMAFSEVVHGRYDPWRTESRDQFQYVSSASATPVAYGAPGYASGAPNGYGCGDAATADGQGSQATRAGSPRLGTPASRAGPSTPRLASASARAASLANAERPPWRGAGIASKRDEQKASDRLAATAKGRAERAARGSSQSPRAPSAGRARPRSAGPAPSVSFAADAPLRSAAAGGALPRVGVPHHLAGPHAAHVALPSYDPSAYAQAAQHAAPTAEQFGALRQAQAEQAAQQAQAQQAQAQQAAQAAHAQAARAQQAMQQAQAHAAHAQQLAQQQAQSHQAQAAQGGPQPLALGYGTWPPPSPAAPAGGLALQFYPFQPAHTAQLNPRSYRGLPASAMWPIPAAGVRSRRADNLPR